MSEAQTTVFIVDDDEAVRDSLKMLMESVDLHAEVFASAHEFLQLFDDDRSGCLVLDIRMPGMSGLELQAVLNERRSMLPVIFITGHGDVPMAVQAIRGGAQDFIQKPFREQELLDRVQQVLAEDSRNRDVLHQKRDILERLSTLTPREREVLGLVVAGNANKVIAIDLGLSQRTVEIHRAHVMDKMQTKSLAHLVRMMISVEDEEEAS
ncbi:MAG: response regulator transcription factor [Pseudomonadales bacterium]|nr:response regulator transcription factor [Gammaproteobacteria bacterium]